LLLLRLCEKRKSRAVCGISKERLFHSFWRRPIFFQKTSRQDRLGATIGDAVDREHALFSPFSSV